MRKVGLKFVFYAFLCIKNTKEGKIYESFGLVLYIVGKQ